MVVNAELFKGRSVQEMTDWYIKPVIMDALASLEKGDLYLTRRHLQEAADYCLIAELRSGGVESDLSKRLPQVAFDVQKCYKVEKAAAWERHKEEVAAALGLLRTSS